MADPMTRDAMIAKLQRYQPTLSEWFDRSGDETVEAAMEPTQEGEYVRLSDVLAALRGAPPADRRINTRCPSCGSATLFVDDHGHLVCSLIGCKEPVVSRAIDALKAAPPADALVEAQHRAERAEGRLREISDLLEDAGVPGGTTIYGGVMMLRERAERTAHLTGLVREWQAACARMAEYIEAITAIERKVDALLARCAGDR